MPRPRAGRVSNNMSEADYREFELAYYKFHPFAPAISFEEYLEDGLHEKEMEVAVTSSRSEDRSDRYNGSSPREYGRGHASHPGRRSHGEPRMPVPREENSQYKHNSSRGLGGHRDMRARDAGNDYDERYTPRGLGGRREMGGRDFKDDHDERRSGAGYGGRPEMGRRDHVRKSDEDSLAADFASMRFGDRGRRDLGIESHGTRSRYANESSDTFSDEPPEHVSRGGQRGAGGLSNREANLPPRGHRGTLSPPPRRHDRGSSRPRQYRQTQVEHRLASDGYSSEHSGSYGPQGGLDGRFGSRRYA